VQEGYKEGALYPYAPNVNVLHDPADLRAKSSYPGTQSGPPGSFAWCSYSGVSTLRGETPQITKASQILHTSQRFLWVEENDPRGDGNSAGTGSWMFNAGTPPDFTDAHFDDSVADWFGGKTTTFSWADGHADAHTWLDAATITYASSMDPRKEDSAAPPQSQALEDTDWTAEHCPTLKNP
jgi:hypothetical protein